MAQTIVDTRGEHDLTSSELRDWLAVQGADSVDIMGQVVTRVHAERRDDLEPTAGQDAWRRRLMNVGHDPLQPPRDSGGR